jgi:predicted RNA-binding protein with PUA-like domain
MKYWLMKSEPDAFSIDALAKAGVEPWSGVRNYQARNFMRQMTPGDGILFYHSSTAVPGVVGLAEVASLPYPDPTQFNKRSHYYDAKSTREEPRWQLVDVRFKRKLARVITLAELKEQAERLDGFGLLARGSRLSVMPVTTSQWKTILSLE